MPRARAGAGRSPPPRMKRAFTIGQTVYQKTAPESPPGIVTGILERPGGAVLYLVTWDIERCADETQHWEVELTVEKGFGA